MNKSILRLGASAAAIALFGAPGVAIAQEATPSVDPKTGPVAFAIPGAFQIAEGTGGSLVRSGTEPGVAYPADSGYPYTDTIPVSADDSAGIQLGINYVGSGQPVPDGAEKNDEYRATAELADTLVPTAKIASDYAVLADNSQDRSASDQLIYINDGRSLAHCPSVDKVEAMANAAGVWVRQADGSQRMVKLYEGEPYTAEKVPVVLAGTLPAEVQTEELFGDITIELFWNQTDNLITPTGFRQGEHSATAGWRVDIEHYWVRDGKRHDLETTSMVLGEVSCSLPDGFKALPGSDNGTGGDDGGDTGGDNTGGDSADGDSEAEVPTSIPSGGGPVDDNGLILNVSAAVGAAAIGSAGFLAYRRRRGTATID